MVKRLLADNLIFLELLTEASEIAGSQRSYATENLLQDLMESHGKFVWMLRSITEKSQKLSMEDVATEAPPQEQPAQPQV
jgi:hypothetical protein